MDRAAARCYSAPYHERTFRHHIARNAKGRAGHRAPARTHLRPRPLRAECLPAARACRSSARSVVHGADRHTDGRLGAPVAGLHRRYPRLDARAVDGRAAVSQPRRRAHAARSRPCGCQGKGPSPGHSGRRRGLLQPCRLQGRAEGADDHARPGRLQPPPGRRTRRWRLRWRLRCHSPGLEAKAR